jgi:Ca-activated chloride channel family protein
MFSIAWPWILVMLPVPALVYFLLPPAKSGQASLRVPFFRLTEVMGSRVYRSSSGIRLICMALVWILIVLAAARPQWIAGTTYIPVSGRDIMLAVDISGSMKAEDMIENGTPENRLSSVKRVARNFIENRVGDRVGLILFGTRAYLQAPLSFDLTTVNTLLQESAIGIAGEKTAIGDAVGLTLKRLRNHYGKGEENEKVLILLTDGANTAGTIDPLKAADLAKSANLRIYTIGVGAESLLLNDAFGQRVVRPSTDLDERTLSAMADLTGGRYFRAVDVNALSKIYDLIDRLEPVEEESKLLRPTMEIFYLPLALAAFLIILFSIIFGKLLGNYPWQRLQTDRPQPSQS